MRNALSILFLLGILFLSSCSGSGDTMQSNEAVVFPPPPDDPKIQYLTSFSKSTDFTGERSAISSFVMGDEETLPIIKPYGIAIGKKKIYICDTILGGLEVFEMEDGTFAYFIPDGRGKLRKPINCFVDDAGFLYVADVDRGQVIIFNEEFDYVAEIGDSTILKPTDVFVYGNQIFINDITKQSVDVFDKATRKFIRSLPLNGGVTAKLFSPTNIYVSKNKLYVSDIGDFKVKIFDLDGNFINSVGTIGSQPGTFSRPKGIAVDRDENIYVVDAGFENVQIFNPDGKLLMFFGGPYNKPGDMWLPAKVAINYNNLDYFEKFVSPDFSLKYLIFVTNQYGPDKINVYGFIEEKNNN